MGANRDHANRPTRLTASDRIKKRGPWPRERRGNVLPILGRGLIALIGLLALGELLRGAGLLS